MAWLSDLIGNHMLQHELLSVKAARLAAGSSTSQQQLRITGTLSHSLEKLAEVSLLWRLVSVPAVANGPPSDRTMT